MELEIHSELITGFKTDYQLVTAKSSQHTTKLRQRIAEVAKKQQRTIDNIFTGWQEKYINGVLYIETNRFGESLFQAICTGFEKIIKTAIEKEELKANNENLKKYYSWKTEMEELYANQPYVSKKKGKSANAASKKQNEKSLLPETEINTPNILSQSITKNNTSFLQSLANTSWILLHDDDYDCEPNFLTFESTLNSSALIAKLQYKYQLGIQNNYKEQFEAKRKEEDSFGVLIRPSRPTKPSKPIPDVWEGIVNYNYSDNLLSMVLFRDKQDQIQITIVMDERLSNIFCCLGTELLIRRNKKHLSKEVICLIKASPDVSSLDNKLPNIYELRQEIAILNKTKNAIPHYPVVHDLPSLKAFFKSIYLKKHYIFQEYYSLFLNIDNEYALKAKLRISGRYFSNTTVTLYIRDRDSLATEMYSGQLYEGPSEFTCVLSYSDENSKSPLFLYLNLPRPDERIDLLTGALFGPLFGSKNKISCFAFAVDEDLLPDKKINRYLVTKILKDYKVGDKIGSDKYEITTYMPELSDRFLHLRLSLLKEERLHTNNQGWEFWDL